MTQKADLTLWIIKNGEERDADPVNSARDTFCVMFICCQASRFISWCL